MLLLVYENKNEHPNAGAQQVDSLRRHPVFLVRMPILGRMTTKSLSAILTINLLSISNIANTGVFGHHQS